MKHIRVRSTEKSVEKLNGKKKEKCKKMCDCVRIVHNIYIRIKEKNFSKV